MYLGSCDPRRPHKHDMFTVCCCKLFESHLPSEELAVLPTMAGQSRTLATFGGTEMDDWAFPGSGVQDKGLGTRPPPDT